MTLIAADTVAPLRYLYGGRGQGFTQTHAGGARLASSFNARDRAFCVQVLDYFLVLGKRTGRLCGRSRCGSASVEIHVS